MEIKLNYEPSQYRLDELTFNFEELKAGLESSLRSYEDVSVDAMSLKSAKEDRARINKMAKALKDKKKEIKELLLEPMESFGKNIDELVKMCDEVSSRLDKDIKIVEQLIKDGKRNALIEMGMTILPAKYRVSEYENLIKIYVDGHPSLLNVTTTDSTRRSAMEAEVKRITDCAEFIHSTYSGEPQFFNVINNAFFETGDMAKALETLNDFKKKLEQSVPSIDTNEDKYEVTLACKGTINQLRFLKELLKSNGIEYVQLGKMCKVEVK